MKRLLLVAVVILALLICASWVWASNTRVKTMGDVNLIVKDDANIWLFPSTIVKYPNLVILESGPQAMDGATDYVPYAGGAIVDAGTIGLFGLFGQKYPSYPWGITFGPQYPISSYWWGWGWDVNRDVLLPEQKYDLFYGRSFEPHSLGIHIYRLSGYNEIEGYPDPSANPGETVYMNSETSLSIMGFNLGFSSDMDRGTFDASFHYETTSFSQDEGDTNNVLQTIKEADGYNSIGFIARMFYNWTDDVDFVPYLSFDKVNEGAKYPQIKEKADSLRIKKEEHSAISFRIGSGVNLTPRENVLVVLDGGIYFRTSTWTDTYLGPRFPRNKEEREYSYKAIPFYGAGIDVDVSKWLDFRLGFKKWLYKNTYTRDRYYHNEGKFYEVEDASTSAPMDIYIGAAIQFKSLIFDVQVDDDFLNHGPNFLSGYEGKLFPRVSVTYDFK